MRWESSVVKIERRRSVMESSSTDWSVGGADVCRTTETLLKSLKAGREV